MSQKKRSEMPYIITQRDFPDRLYCEYRGEGNYIELTMGQRVFNFPRPVFKTKDVSLLGPFDSLGNTAQMPLLSERAAEVIAEVASEDAQLVPSSVVDRKGGHVTYHVLVPVISVPIIDLEGSEYESFSDGAVMYFRTLRLLDTALGGHMLARDVNYLEHVFVSDEVAHALKGAGCNVELTAPEDINEA